MTPQPNPSFPNPRRTYRPADEWRAIIAAHGVSGLSVSAFCHREDLSPGSFNNWRKRLAAAEQSEPLRSTTTTPAAAFIELANTRHALDAGLKVRLELGAGIVLELSRP